MKRNALCLAMTVTDDTRSPKEKIYDEHFSPLVAALIAKAKEHGITMLAHFKWDDATEDGAHSCTTSIPAIDADHGLARSFLRLVRPRQNALAITIISE